MLDLLNHPWIKYVNIDKVHKNDISSEIKNNLDKLRSKPMSVSEVKNLTNTKPISDIKSKSIESYELSEVNYKYNLNWIDEFSPNDLTIVTFTYNTTEFTKLLVKSLTAFKVNLSACNFTIADNGTEDGDYNLAMELNCNYIDNRNDKLKLNQNNSCNFKYSNSHASLIQYVIDHCNTKYLLLLDNDVCIKYPLHYLYNRMKFNNKLSMGFKNKIYESEGMLVNRLHPCFQFINIEKFKASKAKYYFRHRETGTDFYKINRSDIEVVDDMGKNATYDGKYFIHFRGRSLIKVNYKIGQVNTDKINNYLDEINKIKSIDSELNFNSDYDNDKDYKFIISFTSWRGRLFRSALPTLISLLNQNMNVKFKVVLTLSTDEVGYNIPTSILYLAEKFKNRFDLNFVKRDIRSHKKLIPVYTKYTECPILITDDDVIREPDWAQGFYDEYVKYPNMVSTRGANLLVEISDTLKFKSMEVLPYNDDIRLRAVNGAAGTLYPPHVFDKSKQFFDQDLFMELSPSSDESWIWFWQALLGIKTHVFNKIKQSDLNDNRIQSVQDVALFRENCGKNYGEIHKKLLKEFPEVRRKIKL